MGYNAIEIDGEVKLDLSEDTVTEETLPEGVTAHDANGEPIQGKMKFVKSINGKTGEVTLNASDVGAEDAGTVSTHNTNTEAHNDIRLELTRLSGIINDVLDSDDVDLNELHEIVAYIKSNSALIAAITVSKVNVADIINNLTTNVADKPLSAAQGVELNKNKLDASKLTEAINTALAEAKASGEFDGKDGNPGRGIDSVEINDDGELVITYSDSNTETAGKVKGEDGVLTPEQEALLAAIPDLKAWYDEEHYVKMTGSFTPQYSSKTVDIGTTIKETFTWNFSKELKELYINNVPQQSKLQNGDTGELTIEFLDSEGNHIEGTKSISIKGVHAGPYGDENAYNVWTFNFYNKLYYGARAGETIDEEGVKELSKSAYATHYKNTGFNLNDSSSDKYLWYVFPERFEDKKAPVFTVGGFEGSFKKVATIQDFANDALFEEPYSVYRSIFPGICDMTVTVS